MNKIATINVLNHIAEECGEALTEVTDCLESASCECEGCRSRFRGVLTSALMELLDVAGLIEALVRDCGDSAAMADVLVDAYRRWVTVNVGRRRRAPLVSVAALVSSIYDRTAHDTPDNPTFQVVFESITKEAR